MGFALALLLGATSYLPAVYLLLNIGLIPLSPAAVYKAKYGSSPESSPSPGRSQLKIERR
jgi:hypothetical protein